MGSGTAATNHMEPTVYFETPLYYALVFAHLASLIAAFGAVMVTDFFGLCWIADRVPFRRLLKVAGTTEKLIWAGLAGMILSGVPLLIFKGFVDELMVVKLFFVGLAAANGVALYFILHALRRHRDADAVPTLLMYRVGLSLAVSQVAWWGALVIGFLHRQVWSAITWPPRPWLTVSLVAAGLLALWLAGEWLLRQYPSRVKVESEDDAGRIERGPGPTLDPLGKEH